MAMMTKARLPADYDLELYDERGQRIAAPSKRGKRSEEIRMKLFPGRYYIKVSGYAGAWNARHPYQLKLGMLKSHQEDDND